MSMLVFMVLKLMLALVVAIMVVMSMFRCVLLPVMPMLIRVVMVAIWVMIRD